MLEVLLKFYLDFFITNYFLIKKSQFQWAEIIKLVDETFN